MKPEQERVRHLLTDTVSLLCKNGLQFQEELKIEGVIGITVDSNEVFIVHVNEAFRSDGTSAASNEETESGSVNATALAELPGISSGATVKTTARNRAGFRTSRPFGSGSGVRRGYSHFHRRNIQANRSRTTLSQNRNGRHSTSEQSTAVVQRQTDSISPTDILEVDAQNSTTLKEEPQSPRNEEILETNTSGISQNNFENLTLEEMPTDNMAPLFDTMSSNVENQMMEPPAKRQNIQSDQSALDSLITVVTGGESENTAIDIDPAVSTSSDWTAPPVVSYPVESPMKQEPPQNIDIPYSNNMSSDWPVADPNSSSASNTSYGSTLPSSTSATVPSMSQRHVSSDKTSISRHSTSGQTQLLCPYCSETFHLKGHLKDHLSAVHATRPKYPCTVCTTVLSSQKALTRHMKMHTGTQRFQCPLCSKKFQERHGFESHMNKHAGVRPYPCTYCHKSFASMDGCKSHMKKCKDHVYNQ